MNTDPNSFGARIRTWREARGLSRSQACRVLRLRLGTLQDWEQGFHSPRALAAEGLIARMAAYDEQQQQESKE